MKTQVAKPKKTNQIAQTSKAQMLTLMKNHMKMMVQVDMIKTVQMKRENTLETCISVKSQQNSKLKPQIQLEYSMKHYMSMSTYASVFIGLEWTNNATVD